MVIPLPARLFFLFNRGPGASSSPLHMRAFGPVRLKKEADTTVQINNAYSLLDVADLVFIDPAGTGFTKTVDMSKAAVYWDVANDAQATINIIKAWQKNITVSRRRCLYAVKVMARSAPGR